MIKAIQYLDRFIIPLFTKQEFLDEEHKYLELELSSKEKAFGASGFYALDAIDQKVSSLLTHVSIMIAALSLFAVTVITKGITHYLLIIENICYISITIGLLRCIIIIGPEFIGPEYGSYKAKDDFDNKLTIEVCFRRRLYQFLLDVTITITFLFVITLIIHYALPSG